MYRGKKISVAMTTFNGERYIKEQLDSILNQPVVVDEIIISDDGSVDQTVSIVQEYVKKSIKIPITVLTNNQNHGISGNFSWAIRHANGDIIFVCGQDDVWKPEKVQKIADVFVHHTDAELVCHSLSFIDQNGLPLYDQRINSVINNTKYSLGEEFHANREQYFDAAASHVLFPGPAICISQELAEKALPIPSGVSEDWWFPFCAVADDKAFYINLPLTKYRIHDSTSRSVGMSATNHIKKVLKNVKTANNRSTTYLSFADRATAYLETIPGENNVSQKTNWTLFRVRDVGRKVITAQTSGRIKGAVLLTKLYLTDIRYRRIGYKNYLIQLAYTIIYGKKQKMS